jgi:hypothetical protein
MDFHLYAYDDDRIRDPSLQVTTINRTLLESSCVSAHVPLSILVGAPPASLPLRDRSRRRITRHHGRVAGAPVSSAFLRGLAVVVGLAEIPEVGQGMRAACAGWRDVVALDAVLAATALAAVLPFAPAARAAADDGLVLEVFRITVDECVATTLLRVVVLPGHEAQAADRLGRPMRD